MKKFLTLIALLMAFAANGFADTWTVAGNNAALFGEDNLWNPNPGETVNDMTQYEGTSVYYWQKTGVTFASETEVEFKVCKDHSWDESYGNNGDNFGKEFPAGTYDVTIIFDSETKAISVSLSTDTWTAAGSGGIFDEFWDITDTNGNYALSTTDGITYTLTKSNISLYAGTYEYKVAKNHSWDENYPSENKSYTIPKDGPYNVTITFNNYTKELSETIEPLIAEITSVKFSYGISGEDWSNVTLTKAAEGFTYTGTLDLSAVEVDQGFKLNINDGIWLGTQELTVAAVPTTLITLGSTKGDNITLNHANSGFTTYTITATWTESTDASAGWTLNIVGKDARIYTYYFVDGEGWGNIKAYAWTTTGGTDTPVTEAWPGDDTELQEEKYNGYNVYKFSSTIKPDYIIFNNNNGKQTANLPFYDGGTFKNVLEAYVLFAKVGTGEWTYNQAVPLTVAISGYFVFTIGGNAANTEFIIAPSNAIDQNDATNPTIVDWNKLIRPVTNGENWLVENHKDYTGATSALSPYSWKLSSDFSGTSVYLAYNPTALAEQTNGTFLIANGDEMDKATITSAGWATYSNAEPYAIYGESLEVYIVTAADGSNAALTKLNATTNPLIPAGVVQLPAGTGILIKGNAGDYSVCPSFDKAELGMQDVTGNKLIGSCDNNYVITGYDETFGNYTPYIFMNGNDGVGFYKLNVTSASEAEKTLAAHKAFLAAPDGLAPFLAINGEATGIQNIERTLNDGLFYDLSGRRVENPTKGLYIHNGKKVVIK